MKVVIIHGQNHKGSTYHIARMVAEKSAGNDGQITEFFLPKDFGEFCLGCKNCFNESETKCPHYEKAVMEVDWEGVSARIKKSIDKKTSALAKKIIRREGKVKPGLKTKAFFFVMYLLQRKGFNPRDVQHWKSQGWTGKVRPWKCEKNK